MYHDSTYFDKIFVDDEFDEYTERNYKDGEEAAIIAGYSLGQYIENFGG